MAASRNQLHQYYIYGKFQDCSMYNKAMKSYISYKATKSTEDRVSFFSCQFFKKKKWSSKAADLFIWLLCLIYLFVVKSSVL